MIRLVAFTLALIVAPALVSADPITHPSQLNPYHTVIDFENFSAGSQMSNPLVIGNATFTSLTGTLSILNIAASGWPANGTAVASKTLFPGGEPDSAISITFSKPVSEFLLGWGDPNFPGNVLLAYDTNGNLLEQAAVELGPPGGIHAAWIGFKRSTADIARVVVQPDQSQPSGDDYVIDNVRYKTATSNAGAHTFTKIADTLDGAISQISDAPEINSHGLLVFPVRLTTGGGAILAGDGQSLITIVSSATTPEFGGFAEAVINDSGTVAFIALDQNGSAVGIFASDGGALTPIADSVTWGIGALAINNAGTVAWVGASARVLAWNAGSVSVIADLSDGFGNFSDPALINNTGAIAFLAGAPPGTRFPSGASDAIFVHDSSGIRMIFDNASAVSQGQGGFRGGISAMNDASRVLFRYMVSPDLSGLFVADGNSTTLVVDETGSFGLVSESASLNDLDQVAFVAERRDQQEGGGFYVGPDAEMDKVIAPGDALLGRTVLSVGGTKRALNDRGQIAFLVDFTDGSQAVIRADPLYVVGAIADTYVRSGAPNTNEGASDFLRIRDAGDNRVLVRFDQAAIAAAVGNQTILAATLQMDIVDNGNNWGPNGRTASLHRMLVGWAEGNGREADYGQSESFRGDVPGATWKCAIDVNTANSRADCSGVSEWEMAKPSRPDLHPWMAAPSASTLITKGQTGVVEWDVTAEVQAFLAGAVPNYGWIVKKTDEGQPGRVDFASRETGHGPRLLLRLGP